MCTAFRSCRRSRRSSTAASVLRSGGRVTRVAGVPGDPIDYYAATASGGVWKSTDGGLTWKPIFDDQPTSIDRLDRRRAVRSERRLRRARARRTSAATSPPGNGIYKSTDAGKTWTHVWTQDGQIGTMVVHPQQPRHRLRRRARARLRPERRSAASTAPRDGGKTWSRCSRRTTTPAPRTWRSIRRTRTSSSPASGRRARRPWDLTSGGPGSGLYVSRDGGDTWKRSPAKRPARRASGARSAWPWRPSDGRRVYALIEAEKGGLFRSDDGGETWSARHATARLRQRAWYYSTLTVNPSNPDDVWFPQVPMLRTHRRRQDASSASAGCITATTTTSGSIRRTRSG